MRARSVIHAMIPNISPLIKLMYKRISLLLNLSIITPAYKPQNKPRNVKMAYKKVNVELAFIVSVKYQGIAIIISPWANPEVVFVINNNIISINLGRLSHHWEDIPLTREVDTLNVPIQLENFTSGVAVNVGNPHIVFFGKNINLFDLNSFGPKIENHELFPDKTNVEIVEIVNRKVLKMRVWERGAGITLACGSGACAAVYASTLKDMTDNDVEVKLVKGSLRVKIQNNEAIMMGPAEESLRGYIEI